VIEFFANHPIILGTCIGGGMIGGPLGIIGWCVGYDHAMRQVGRWVNPPKREEAMGDVPLVPSHLIPPRRDRRQVGRQA